MTDDDFLKQTITISIKTGDEILSYSLTKWPINLKDAVDWFEYQVLPALGYESNRSREIDDD